MSLTTRVPKFYFYLDHVLHLITTAETKVLIYVARRTDGFNKESDRISLPQFTSGITKKNGGQIDGGTGLCESTVAKALKSLIDFKVLTEVSKAIQWPPEKRQAAEYSLQLDLSQVDFDGLERRATEAHLASRKKNEAARTEAAKKKAAKKADKVASQASQPSGGFCETEPFVRFVGQKDNANQ